MIDHAAIGAHGARSRAGIDAPLIDAGLTGRAIGGGDALRPARRSETDHAGQTGALGRAGHHSAAAVRAARVSGTGIRR